MIGGPLLLLALVIDAGPGRRFAAGGRPPCCRISCGKAVTRSQIVQKIGERRLAGLARPAGALRRHRPGSGPPVPATCDRRSPRLSLARVDAGTGFALLLTVSGLLLVLAPEFVFLRDVFNARSNTIFKLYYQAWLLFGVAAAWAVDSFFAEEQDQVPATRSGRLDRLRHPARIAVSAGRGVHPRFRGDRASWLAAQPTPLSLDGGPGFINNDDYAGDPLS